MRSTFRSLFSKVTPSPFSAPLGAHLKISNAFLWSLSSPRGTSGSVNRTWLLRETGGKLAQCSYMMALWSWSSYKPEIAPTSHPIQAVPAFRSLQLTVHNNKE